MKKKILWVEDNADSVRNWELFERNLSESDLKNLSDMEREGKDFEFEIKDFLEKKNIFIEEGFSGACKRIFEEDFDVIVLDVKFSTEPGNTNEEKQAVEEAKNLFANAFHPFDEQHSEIETIFSEILGNQEYGGLLLFYVICLHYENRKGIWNLSDIKTKVCFLSAHSKRPGDLLAKYEALKWNPQIGNYVREVENNFWNKIDEGLVNVKAFIEKDPYLDILEKYLGKTEKERFANVLQTQDDETQIEVNLHNLRKIQEKMLEKLANDVSSFQGMRNRYLQGGKINVRGSLRWLNDNPDSFHIRPEDIRDWDKLFDVLKDCSDDISKRIYEFLHYRSRKRVSNWSNDQDIEGLKVFVLKDINAIINRKDFFFRNLIPERDKKDEYGKIHWILNKKFYYVSDSEYKKLNRFLVDRVLSQAIRKREIYFDDVHYHLALSIHAIGSEAAHGAVIKQPDVLYSMIYAMKCVILKFGELCGQKAGLRDKSRE
ncbi:hypothetical protein [Desulfonema magnum]|uniref:Uncharacterized protein n=1 Tax=Desulfonema magnum TaxID=45655 RepID=A0A975GK32_9BACT|nr:hypothetical protein [Desulfonema magnum]QTA84192.1 Uncharacterized protein dnm_001860 [Desulfonema magnum]